MAEFSDMVRKYIFKNQNGKAIDIKILVLGKDFVGKKSLVYRYIKYSPPPPEEIGVTLEDRIKTGTKIDDKYCEIEILDLYNDEVYQTVPNTGNVVKGNTNADLLTLDKYVYPVDKYAYNLDECNITLKDGTENVKGCPVTQTLNVATFKRNSGIDPLQSAMKTNNKFNCYVKVDPPTVSPCKDIEKCTLYRNVDESNLFPNNIAVANNWATPEGQAAIEFIQENSEKLRTTDELLEYRITLNPTQIKAIKEYNRKAGSYINESTHDCDTVDDMYLNCKSEFMDTLRGNNTEYPTGSLGNIDFNHQDGLNNNASSLKIPKVNEEGN